MKAVTAAAPLANRANPQNASAARVNVKTARTAPGFITRVISRRAMVVSVKKCSATSLRIAVGLHFDGTTCPPVSELGRLPAVENARRLSNDLSGTLDF